MIFFRVVSSLASRNTFSRRNSRRKAPIGKLPTPWFWQEVRDTLRHEQIDGGFIVDSKWPIEC